MDDEISIFHLILESRHFTLSLLNAMKFWTCSLLALAALQLLSLLLTLPTFLTAAQALFASSVSVPALALSLLGARTDPNVMGVSTGKNAVAAGADAARFAAWCYGTRFAPAILVLLLAHLLCVVGVGGAVEAGALCAAAAAAGNATLASTVDAATVVDVGAAYSRLNCTGNETLIAQEVRKSFLSLYVLQAHSIFSPPFSTMWTAACSFSACSPSSSATCTLWPCPPPSSPADTSSGRGTSSPTARPGSSPPPPSWSSRQPTPS